MAITEQSGTVEVRGETFSWTVDDGMVVVSNPDVGTKTRQLGRSPAETIAQLLAVEMLQEGSSVRRIV